jgi:hypothetical protein
MSITPTLSSGDRHLHGLRVNTAHHLPLPQRTSLLDNQGHAMETSPRPSSMSGPHQSTAIQMMYSDHHDNKSSSDYPHPIHHSQSCTAEFSSTADPFPADDDDDAVELTAKELLSQKMSWEAFNSGQNLAICQTRLTGFAKRNSILHLNIQAIYEAYQAKGVIPRADRRQQQGKDQSNAPSEIDRLKEEFRRMNSHQSAKIEMLTRQLANVQHHLQSIAPTPIMSHSMSPTTTVSVPLSPLVLGSISPQLGSVCSPTHSDSGDYSPCGEGDSGWPSPCMPNARSSSSSSEHTYSSAANLGLPPIHPSVPSPQSAPSFGSPNGLNSGHKFYYNAAVALPAPGIVMGPDNGLRSNESLAERGRLQSRTSSSNNFSQSCHGSPARSSTVPRRPLAGTSSTSNTSVRSLHYNSSNSRAHHRLQSAHIACPAPSFPRD